MFFVVQLDPPIKHGQTRYHFVILLFEKNSHVELEMTATDEWLDTHYGGKLTREVSGPEYEVVARVFKVWCDLSPVFDSILISLLLIVSVSVSIRIHNSSTRFILSGCLN